MGTQTSIISCMYDYKDDFTGIQRDFFQLGWLLAWVLSPEGDYHKRCWDDVKYKMPTFVRKLIEEGKYCEDDLVQL